MKKSSIHHVHDVYKTMCSNNLSIIYQGHFDQEITKGVLSMVEQNFSNNAELDELIKRRIFNVMVEVLQNICKHQGSSNEYPAIFIVGKDQGSNFSIISGNLVYSENNGKLVDNIEKINSLDKEELKVFYKEAKLNSTISAVGGAGLGFIDIARKSGSTLKYCMKQIADDKHFFIFKSIITNQKQ
jgi:hypothetical protein